MSRTHRYNKKTYSDKNSTNNHHLVNKCNWGRDIADNIKRLKTYVHKSIHEVFGNQDPWNMLFTIKELGDTARDDDFKPALTEFLDKRKWKMIKKECYKWRTLYNNWIKAQI